MKQVGMIDENKKKNCWEMKTTKIQLSEWCGGDFRSFILFKNFAGKENSHNEI